MNKFIKTFFIAGFMLSHFILHSQFVEVESSIPPGTHWKEITNSSVKIVFPSGMEKEAGRIASMVELLNSRKVQSLGNKVRKIDIFLINTSLESNGYVKVPPFHSKFYTRAPIDAFAGSTDWLDLLTIHEYRHVMQYNNALSGITKYLYYIFGEPLLAGSAHLAIPPWFWEGDATVQETALSFSGRGRMPGFSADLKAIAKQEKIFSYEKMNGGSFRDRIPNHYSLGYSINAYGRYAYGPEFWPEVFQDAVRYKRIFWPFSSAVKKKTGKRIKEVYQTMMNQQAEELTSVDEFDILKVESSPKNPTEYKNPQFRSEDEIIAIKESFNKEAYFVSIDLKAKEKELFPVGFGMGKFDVGNKYLVWNELSNHPRWADQGFSDLFIYDFEKGESQKLTEKGSYFSPGLSPNESKIFCVQSDPLAGDEILLLSRMDGKKLREIPNPEKWKIGHHCWLNEEEIAIVVKKKNRNALVMMNIADGKSRFVIDFQIDLIEYPSFYHDKIYYQTNAGNAQNQLFAIDLQTKQISRSKINTPFAMNMSELSGQGKIAFVETAFNHKLLRVVYESIHFDHAISSVQMEDEQRDENNFSETLANMITTQEDGPIVDDIPEKNFQVKDYRPGFSKMKLHTWMFNPSHPNYSVIFQANDPLGTVGLSAIPGYNLNEGTFFTDINLSYGAYYPKLGVDFGIRNGRRASFTDQEGNQEELIWDEKKIGTSIQLPLSYTKRNYYYYFQPVIGYERIAANWYRGDRNSSFDLIYFEARGGAIRKRSYRSLASINSFDASVSFQKAINNNDKINLTTQFSFYLPGLNRSHSTRLRFSHKFQDKENQYITFNNYHYGGSYNTAIQSNHVSSARLEYAFPLSYPDLSIGPFVFMKRLRMSFFNQWDLYSGGMEANSLYHYFGANLILDAKYFRLLDIPIGFQLRFINRDGDVQFDNFSFIFEL